MGFHDNAGNYHAFRGSVPISLYDWREVDANGDVGDATANGGLLASDTTPILRGATTTERQEISWATGDEDPIACHLPLPPDFSAGDDVLIELDVSSGTTDAASFVVQTGWQGSSSAPVSDTADDSETLSASEHRITVRIAHADIPAGARHVTVQLTPPAHATNAIQLHNAELTFVRKVVS